MRSFTTVMLVFAIVLAGISYGLSGYALMAGTYPLSWLWPDLLFSPLCLAVNIYVWWIWHSDEQQ